MTFIAGERGQPLTKESFGNLFREACRPAVSGRVASACGSEVFPVAATNSVPPGMWLEFARRILR